MKNNNPLFLVYDDLGLGGIQIKIIDIIKQSHIRQPKRKIILCLLKEKGILFSKIPAYTKILSLKTITKKGFRKFNKIYSIFWLAIQMVKFSPKKILAFMNHPAIISIIASKIIFFRKIKIFVGQDCTASIHISKEPRPKINHFLVKKLYPTAEKILVQTKVQKTDLVEKFSIDSNRIKISPNWLPFDFLKSKTIKNSKKNDIVFIGRLDPQKNLKKFIKIISLVQKKIPDIKVKIIGSGSESEILKKYTAKLGLSKNIKFSPAVLNPQKFYSESKIYLLTSYYEGFPLTLLEAISQNCVPVFYNISEVSIFFTKFKKIIQFNSIKEASSKIIFLLENHETRENIIDFYSKKVYLQQKTNLSKLLDFFD